MRVRLALVVALLTSGGVASGQNDWQFPDPYFGIVEIEKSRLPGSDGRYRAEIAPAPKPAVKPRSNRRGYRAERMRRVGRP